MECVAESRDHAGEVVSAIEGVIEFGEVSWHVLGADRTVGAVDRGFDIAECGVDPFEGGVADRSRTTARQDRLMLASSIGHAMKTGHPVADHRAGRVEAVQRKSRNRLAGAPRDAAQFQPDRLAVVGGFDVSVRPRSCSDLISSGLAGLLLEAHNEAGGGGRDCCAG